jgi:putative aldouronate transport system permease protein
MEAIEMKKQKRALPARKLKSVKIGEILIVIFISLLCLTCIVPFIHVIAKSISSDGAVLAKSVYLLPKEPTLKAYTTVFEDGQLTHSMIYTVYMTLIFTVLGMVVTICAAYPLSKKRLKGRVLLSFLIMLTMYFSAGLIPTYLLYKNLNLLDTMWVLILPLMFSPYNMLIMKSFFQSSIPESLEESAFLDGANHFRIIWSIVLPLSKPIIATLSLFYAVGRWNAYGDAKYYVTTKALQPLQYILSNMILNSTSDAISLSESAEAAQNPEVLQAAMIVFSTAPIILLYPFVQRYFVKGVMIGAVKG